MFVFNPRKSVIGMCGIARIGTRVSVFNQHDLSIDLVSLSNLQGSSVGFSPLLNL